MDVTNRVSVHKFKTYECETWEMKTFWDHDRNFNVVIDKHMISPSGEYSHKYRVLHLSMPSMAGYRDGHKLSIIEVALNAAVNIGGMPRLMADSLIDATGYEPGAPEKE